jgi:nucleoid-associated protein YgaU
MNRKITLVLLISFLLTFSAFAHHEPTGLELVIPEFTYTPYFADDDVTSDDTAVADDTTVTDDTTVSGTAKSEDEVIQGIQNNEFYTESLRLTQLAKNTYDAGDYEASAGMAEEAYRYALLSDEYVSGQLITETKRLLDWADGNNIPTRFPNNYNQAKNYYDTSVIAHADEEWPTSIENSMNAIEILAAFESGATVTVRPAATASSTTAATGATTTTATTGRRQYTVRTWIVEKDCLWNIAGYSWVYNDPWKWRLIYEANKSKMPDPNNPDLIEPGMVLDIPDLPGTSNPATPAPSSRTPPTNR